MLNKDQKFEPQRDFTDHSVLLPELRSQTVQDNLTKQIPTIAEAEQLNKSFIYYNVISLDTTKRKISLINIEGSIYTNSLKEIYRYVKKSIFKNHHLVFLNFEKLTYINCYAMNMLISITKDKDYKKNRLIIVSAPPKIITLFKLVGIHELFNFQPNLPFALKNSNDSFLPISVQKENTVQPDALNCCLLNQTNLVSFETNYYCYQCNVIINQHASKNCGENSNAVH